MYQSLGGMTQINGNSGWKAEDPSPVEPEVETGPVDKRDTRGRKEKVGGHD